VNVTNARHKLGWHTVKSLSKYYFASKYYFPSKITAVAATPRSITTVWVKKKSPLRFSEIFSQTVGNFWSIFYTPKRLLYDHFYTRVQIFIQISPTLTKLCHTKRDHLAKFYISLELNFDVCLLSKWRLWWRHAISYMFIDIIKVFIL